MVKRGIGAAVLAILAALLIGYLLKGKGQERQAVVDMSLPGAQEVKKSLNIPALKGDTSGSNLTQKTNNSSASESVVASAEGAPDKINQATKDIKTKETAVNTFKNKGDDLDFTLRPPKGEKREFVDNIGKDTQHQRTPRASISSSNSEGGVVASTSGNTSTHTNPKNSSGSITRSSQGTVVASSDDSEAKRRTYRPRLEGERRRSANYGLATETSVRKSRERKEREQRRAERKREKAKEKAKEKEKQSVTASDSKKGHYTIQLLATSSSSRATNLKNVMRKEGYSSYISKTSRNGKTLFRVRIGNYTSQRSAKSVQRTMQRRYQKNQQVKESIIVSR